MKPFTITSRYGDTRTISPINVSKGIFVMHGVSDFSRGAEGMFDFQGGPMLMVGEPFYGLGTIAGLSTDRPVPESTGEGSRDWVPPPTDTVVYIFVDYNTDTLQDILNKKQVSPAIKPSKMTYDEMLIIEKIFGI